MTTDNNIAVKVSDLYKSYGSLVAVNKISFSIKKGCCFGILGPNGAGKTTLVEMIEGITPMTSGSIKVLGFDVKKELKQIQPRIGVQLQENAYFNFLNVKQILTFFRRLHIATSVKKTDKKPSVDEILERVSLLDKKKSKIKELSGGQKQRLSIGISLLGDPDILFLDEPTAGLDPKNRRQLWDYIRDIVEGQKKTVVMTTHYLDEAETLCDEIIIMDKGEIKAQGSPAKIISSLSKYHTISLQIEAGKLDFNYIKSLPGISSYNYKEDENTFEIITEMSVDNMKSLIEYAESNNLKIESFDIKKANLEEVFLYITKEGERK